MSTSMARGKSSMHPKLARAQILVQSGMQEEALALLEKLCRKDKRNGEAFFLLGTLLGQSRNYDKASYCLQRAVKLMPNHALCHFNLGNILVEQGKFSAAIKLYSKALLLEPNKPEILRALAKAEINSGKPDRAIPVYRKYLQYRPDDPDILGNLAACYFHSGQLENAVKIYKLALDIRNDVNFLDGLSASLCQQGRPDESIAMQREALQLQPDNAKSHSNLLLKLNYLPDITAELLYSEHCEWPRKQKTKNVGLSRDVQAVDLDRGLRIAYVSSDFRKHSVSYFFAPLLQHHNSDNVETWCYATSPQSDDVTVRLKEMADHWCDISSFNDAKAIEQILSDKIDILIDLSGHTAGNRLTIFAAKPAPVQVTYLGYPATTGLPEIDYRLTDEIADPPDQDQYYSEKLIRLSSCFLCFEPYSTSPEVAPLPVLKNGFVTFGSFNNLAKINDSVISVWASLLNNVPNSRLLIKNPSLTDSATAQRYLSLFVKHGISEERIELRGLAPSTEEHLDTYKLVDIALDTFPYNGTTTTCEALHMGVPVVTLKGSKHASRVSASLLAALDLGELVAASQDDYVSIAETLADSQNRLSEYRKTLRSRMAASSLSDGAAFVRNMEQVYRDIWQEYCKAAIT